MHRTVESLQEFSACAHEFTQLIVPHESGAVVVALSGELGAGKTTFAQAVARSLGVQETVSSPTFVIEKAYQLIDQRFERLVHIDAYRLKSAHELEVLSWRQMLADPANLILIEWPERVADLIPHDAIRIRFEIAADGRIITIDHGSQKESDKDNR